MRISMMTYTMARELQPGEKFDAVGLCEFCKELNIDAIDWVTVYHYEPAELRRITPSHHICFTEACGDRHCPLHRSCPVLPVSRRSRRKAESPGFIPIPESGHIIALSTRSCENSPEFNSTWLSSRRILRLERKLGDTVLTMYRVSPNSDQCNCANAKSD